MSDKINNGVGGTENIAVAKVTLGIRVTPEHKQKLSLEANQLGISLSERGENILLCSQQLTSDLEDAKQKNRQLQATNQELQRQTLAQNADYDAALANYKSEIAQLKGLVSKQQEQVQIFNDPRLLDLFSQLKGKSDTVEMYNGVTQTFLYTEPLDLMRVLLYSFKIKKP